MTLIVWLITGAILGSIIVYCVEKLTPAKGLTHHIRIFTLICTSLAMGPFCIFHAIGFLILLRISKG